LNSLEKLNPVRQMVQSSIKILSPDPSGWSRNLKRKKITSQIPNILSFKLDRRKERRTREAIFHVQPTSNQ
jgi:hypothetical protein